MLCYVKFVNPLIPSSFHSFLVDPYITSHFLKCFYTSKDINSARIAKKQLDNYYFFSQCLHVCYGPEYESVEDTRYKLNQRRFFIEQKTKSNELCYNLCRIITATFKFSFCW